MRKKGNDLTKEELFEARRILKKVPQRGILRFSVLEDGTLKALNQPDKNGKIPLGDGKHLIIE